MTDFEQNNLDKAASPYLQQHKDNPIHWQEWSNTSIEHAKKTNKLIFVSVGYATCHWCHVMAHEAFSDKQVADFLNRHFVSIKVDREQRPDIDHYLMSFLIHTQGHGGWPLNAILTPDKKPLMALTYVPSPNFLDILHIAKDKYEKKSKAEDFKFYGTREDIVPENDILTEILFSYDVSNGGFGYGQKFPPHNTLLFLLSYYEGKKNNNVKKMVEKTLDNMAMRGLHDHLQGGFFRYCTDNEWTIPHFEKMLYDQAMLLWIYSAAYKLFGKEEYKIIAEKIIKCLEETFEDKGFFYSAHDADTDHEEGATYLWTKAELENILTREELEIFTQLYGINEYGNFEGKNHLIKKKNNFLSELEIKLLQVRKKRKQPFTDKKIITSWNALAGIALVMAYRCLGKKKYLEKAENLFTKLMKKHYTEGKLHHSSLGDKIQKNEFLEDYASMLLFAIYLHEEEPRNDIIRELLKNMQAFYNGKWFENKNDDFFPVEAQEFDHPTPSSSALAEMASLRARIIFNENYNPGKYRKPLNFDFYNLVELVKNGNFHVIHSPQKIPWIKLPLNAIQIKSDKIQDCYKGRCVPFNSKQELLDFINKEK